MIFIKIRNSVFLFKFAKIVAKARLFTFIRFRIFLFEEKKIETKNFREEFEEMKFIGDYQILREIGKGAFGRVLLAEKDGHQVAIKETLTRSRTALKG